MKIAFVADPISQFNPQAETTSVLAKAFCDKKAECYFLTVQDLKLYNAQLLATAYKAKVVQDKNKNYIYKLSPAEEINLAKFDAVWLRKDPPVDLNFLDHLSLFEIIKNKTQIFNDPSGIKMAPEKILALHHNTLSPPTLISQNQKAILDFIQTHKKAVLKPLNLSGGRGIVIAEVKQQSLTSLVDILTQSGTSFICAQKFVPEAQKGDKRVLLWKDKILGSFLRVPARHDFRGNMHSGATYHKSTLTPKQHKKILNLIPDLKALGLSFVGVDFLGDFISEVNVTSPMGLHELNHLYSSQSEKIIVNSVFASQ